MRDFDAWFSRISLVEGFTFTKDIKALVSTGKGDDYTYHTDRLNPLDPFNPDSLDASQPKSHNNQKGGKMVSNDCGMGPGTTYVNYPSHLVFQFDPWVTSLFASFYGRSRPLIRLMCRFRVKMHASWNNTHVDIDVKTMLPDMSDT